MTNASSRKGRRTPVRRKSAELEARSGRLKKVVRAEPKAAPGQLSPALPKVAGRPLKTFVDDSAVAEAKFLAVSPIVSRQPIAKAGKRSRGASGATSRTRSRARR